MVVLVAAVPRIPFAQIVLPKAAGGPAGDPVVLMPQRISNAGQAQGGTGLRLPGTNPISDLWIKYGANQVGQVAEAENRIETRNQLV